jgi:hypothetical protein
LSIGTSSAPDGVEINVPLAQEASAGTNVRIGVLGSTPRIILSKANKSFEMDVDQGRFRLYVPGQERFTMTEDGNIGIGVKIPIYRMDVQTTFGSGTTTTLFVGQTHVDGAATGRYGVGFHYEHIDGTSAGKKAHIGMWYSNTLTKVMTFNNHGQVGIGTSNPDATLAVNGSIHAKEVRVDLNVPAPDYVFEKEYELMPLSVLSKYLQENKHLPGVPAGKELEEKGVDVAGMEMLLLKKVEELTLYVLELKAQNDVLKQDNEALKLRMQAVEKK